MPTRNKDFFDGKPGYAFKDGKFYRFEKREVLVLQAWPDPRAWRKLPSCVWHHTRKFADQWFSSALYAKGQDPYPPAEDPADVQAGQLLLPFPTWFLAARYATAERRDRMAVDAFLNTIPEDVRNELLLFPQRKWHLLNLFARCPGAFDLSRNNPALAYALASNWVFHKPAVCQPMRAARSLVRRKQREILGWLGFPATESTRRILGKVRPRGLSIKALLYLRTALRDDAARKVLSHVLRINAGVLRLAADPRYLPHVSPAFLEEVSQRPEYEEAYSSPLHVLIDTLKMGEEEGWRHCPKRFSSLPRLMETHDELARRLRPQLERRIRDYPMQFPVPPYRGTKCIHPIMNPHDLLAEGNEMAHCVGTYAEDVAAGYMFVYRVLEPVRATLSLRRSENGWDASELSQYHNTPVAPAIQRALFAELFASGSFKPGEIWDVNQLALSLAM